MPQLETFMLYRAGTTTQCGPHLVDHIIVDEDKVDAELKKGWFKTPKEASDAEEARVAALKAEIQTNADLLKKQQTTPKGGRKPKNAPAASGEGENNPPADDDSNDGE